MFVLLLFFSLLFTALCSLLFAIVSLSGLDSTSSMEVCHALREVAESGVTVLTVIHQPRWVEWLARTEANHSDSRARAQTKSATLSSRNR